MILNGLGFIDDRLYMFPQFLDNKPVSRLFRPTVKAADFNDDALGRALDRIYAYGTTKLFTEIAFAVGVEKKLLGRCMNIDTTSLSLHGEYDEAVTSLEASHKASSPIKITHGYSKDQRFDLKQVILNKGDAFEVASVFLKKPERVEALMVVMTLCLLVYNFAQHKLRKTLESLNETVPNQIKKPTAKPTMAWICRMFHGVHLLRVDHGSQGVQEIVINLTELTRRIIRYFGMVAERIYGLAYG